LAKEWDDMGVQDKILLLFIMIDMTILAKICANEVSFIDFLYKKKVNSRILFLAATMILILFAIFKYFYPFASFIHGDSFSYLEAADKNLDINTYMIGYSRFLRLFSVFSKSDTLLVAFQYFFLQFSAFFLLFSIFYFYVVSKAAQAILLVFMVGNPLSLHLANLISSDCIFLSTSLIWFTSLLWLLHRPSLTIAILHILVLSIAFTLRYNALIYPTISFVLIIIAKLPLRTKILSIGLALLLCGYFITFTSYKYKILTGYWQYSPFSGWQLANNAMYAYRYVDKTERKNVPKQFQVLDNMIRQYFDSTRDIKRFPQEALQASTVYMWSPGLPLFKYRDNLYKKDSVSSELKRWASMGSFYKRYGLTIVKQYPWFFVRYFLLPNASKYYAPPVEFLSSYNSGSDVVTFQAKSWFGFKSQKVKTRFKKKDVKILEYFPMFSGVVNLIMLACLVCYIMLKGWRYQFISAKCVFLGGSVWLANAIFTIGASSPALRFQSFPIVLAVTFVTLLIDWMIRIMKLSGHQSLPSIRVKVEDGKIHSQIIA
jgi:hypothetical protein